MSELSMGRNPKFDVAMAVKLRWRSSTPHLLGFVTLGSAAAIFAIDSLIPVGVAIAVLYTFVIFASSTFLDARGIAAVSIACLVLTLSAFFIGHAGDYDAESTIRCVFSVVVIALTTVLSLQHQRASALTRQREFELQNVINTIPGMVWSAHAASGELAYTNARCEEIGSAAELIGTKWDQVVHPDDTAKRAADWELAFASGTAFENIARYRHRSGAYKWMLARAAPLRNESGAIVRWYGVNTDIDDQRRAENNLLQAQDELSRVTRVTTLGELTASIAHEVNQPLAALISNGEACQRWLTRAEPNLGEAKSSVAMMISNARRASDVITKLRALAGKSRTERSQLDMAGLIDEVLLVVGREIRRKDIELKREDRVGNLAVVGDRVQLQQVILNLVMNAIQAMETSARYDRQLTLATTSFSGDQGTSVVLEVTDTADGIHAQDAERIFDAFYTTKQGGLGMGLTICRSIVEAHQGTISMNSTLGRGTTFRVSLPSRPGASS